MSMSENDHPRAKRSRSVVELLVLKLRHFCILHSSEVTLFYEMPITRLRSNVIGAAKLCATYVNTVSVKAREMLLEGGYNLLKFVTNLKLGRVISSTTSRPALQKAPRHRLRDQPPLNMTRAISKRLWEDPTL